MAFHAALVHKEASSFGGIVGEGSLSIDRGGDEERQDYGDNHRFSGHKGLRYRDQ
jgi:hypothetical protein